MNPDPDMFTDLPTPALDYGLLHGFILPPPWFVPIEAPACGAVLSVPAEATNDGIARRFVCDKIRGHEDANHRHVADPEMGYSFEWER